MAWMVQVPVKTSVMVLPDTVQIDPVWELKLATSPDDAVAVTVNGAAPKAWLESAPNVIVWLSCVHHDPPPEQQRAGLDLERWRDGQSAGETVGIQGRGYT